MCSFWRCLVLKRLTITFSCYNEDLFEIISFHISSVSLPSLFFHHFVFTMIVSTLLSVTLKCHMTICTELSSSWMLHVTFDVWYVSFHLQAYMVIVVACGWMRSKCSFMKHCHLNCCVISWHQLSLTVCGTL